MFFFFFFPTFLKASDFHDLLDLSFIGVIIFITSITIKLRLHKLTVGLKTQSLA